MGKKGKSFDELYNICPISGCWLWNGRLTDRGYAGFGKQTRGHIFAYERKYGKVPVGKELAHSCHIRKCINPDHVLPKTHLDNCRERNTNILSIEKANEIREKYATGNFTLKTLGLLYGVKLQTIHYIVTNVQWKYNAT